MIEVSSRYLGLERKLNVLKHHKENTKYYTWETVAIKSLHQVARFKPKSISERYFVPYL